MDFTPETPLRLDSLTGLRGILAALVLVAHSADRVGLLEGSDYFTRVVANLGNFGVVGFFILSGFILHHVYHDKEWNGRQFFTNRFARIYPLYLAGIIFALPADLFRSISNGQTPEIAAFGTTLIAFQSWFPWAVALFNGPGWTVAVEFFFYLAFPIFIFLQRKSFTGLIGVTVLMFVGVGLLWEPSVYWTSFRFPLMRLNEFALGILLSCLITKRIIPAVHWFWALVALIAGMLIAGLADDFLGFLYSRWFLMIISSAIAIVILGLTDLQGRRSALAGRWWIFAGEVSFGLYLLHDPIQRYGLKAFEILSRVPVEHGSFALKGAYIGVCGAASIVAAILAWKFVEVPARKALRAKLSKRQND